MLSEGMPVIASLLLVTAAAFCLPLDGWKGWLALSAVVGLVLTVGARRLSRLPVWTSYLAGLLGGLGGVVLILLGLSGRSVLSAAVGLTLLWTGVGITCLREAERSEGKDDQTGETRRGEAGGRPGTGADDAVRGA